MYAGSQHAPSHVADLRDAPFAQKYNDLVLKGKKPATSQILSAYVQHMASICTRRIFMAFMEEEEASMHAFYQHTSTEVLDRRGG